MHEVLNPAGAAITLPKWAMRRLRRLGLLVYDRATRRTRISERIRELTPLLETPDFAHFPLRAFDPARTRSSAGAGSALLRTLGRDCSGPSVAVCHCRECESRLEDADTTASPFEGRKVQRR